MTNPDQTQNPPPLPDPRQRVEAPEAATTPAPPPASQLPAPQPPAPQPPARPPRQLRRTAAEDKPFTRGFGTGIGVALGAGLVLIALTLVSLLGMGAVAQRAGGITSEPMTSHVWGPANASNTVLALNISGTIMGADSGSLFGTGTYGYEIADQIDALDADDYAGLVLLMDTPGGTIYGSRAIADSVLRYQERTGKKVVAYVQSMSASGGVYSMAPADHIISDYGTLVGSIGVIFGPISRYRDVTGITGNLLESGVETEGGIEQYYLTRGTSKDFGNPFRDMTDEEAEMYGHGIQVEYDMFVNFVAEHRGIPAETIVDDLGAYMFDPQTAIEKGLVDEIAGRDQAFRSAATVFEVDPEDTRLVSPAAPSALSQLLGAQARVPGHSEPLSTNSGLQATSELCVGSPLVLAYSGDVRQVCGA